jgi:hypothetical protein
MKWSSWYLRTVNSIYASIDGVYVGYSILEVQLAVSCRDMHRDAMRFRMWLKLPSVGSGLARLSMGNVRRLASLGR